MSEVTRYRFISSNGYAAIPVVDSVKAERYVEEQEFDRVTAENSALQALLTAADERADVLEGLLRMAAYHVRISGTDSEIDAIDAALKPGEGGGDE